MTRATRTLLGIGAALVSGVAAIVLYPSQQEWAGVDEAVIGRLVTAAGREPRPIFDWVQGDLLLFAFLCAGLFAGFVIGFYGRAVFGAETRPREDERETDG